MAVPLAQALGTNARKLRLEAGVTLEQFASAAQTYGLSWSTGRVGDFEGGRVAPTFPNIYAVALTLRDVTGKPVKLADLVYGNLKDRLADLQSGDDEVALNDTLNVPFGALLDAVNGLPVSKSDNPDAEVAVDETSSFRESDYRLARELLAPPDSVMHQMLEMWGRPFSAERDARAGADANAQRKGQVSRQLKSELLESLLAAKERAAEKMAEFEQRRRSTQKAGDDGDG